MNGNKNSCIQLNSLIYENKFKAIPLKKTQSKGEKCFVTNDKSSQVYN